MKPFNEEEGLMVSISPLIQEVFDLEYSKAHPGWKHGDPIDYGWSINLGNSPSLNPEIIKTASDLGYSLGLSIDKFHKDIS